MARPREELHGMLVDILGSGNVYYQPPESVRMRYPCIVYGLSSRASTFADGGRYIGRNVYKVTVIDADPDSEVPDRVLALPYCSHDSRFTADNLNHDVFTIYF